MIFVDSGHLFAALNPRDQLYSRSIAWSQLVREPLLTTEYVLWELVNKFSGPADRPKMHDALDDIRTHSDWNIIAASADLFGRGLTLHRQHADKAWTLTDCISFVVMRQRGIQQALTHDHHFEQAGFEALLRRDPP